MLLLNNPNDQEVFTWLYYSGGIKEHEAGVVTSLGESYKRLEQYNLIKIISFVQPNDIDTEILLRKTIKGYWLLFRIRKT